MLRYITKTGGRDRPILRGATVPTQPIRDIVFINDIRTNDEIKNCYYVIILRLKSGRLFKTFLRVLVKLPVSKELYVFVCSRRRTPVGTKFIQNRSVNNDSGLQTE